MKPHDNFQHRLTAAGFAIMLAFAPVGCGGSDSAVPTTSPTAAATSDTEVPLDLPTKRSDITPTPGDLPNGVYRFTEDLALLQESDPTGSFSASDEGIMEFVLKDGISEVHYFNMDSSPQAGQPPDTGGVYEVHGNQVIFATPPERSIPGTNGIYLLRWSLDGDTLTFDQIDDHKVDADYMAPWVRVGGAP